VAAALKKSGEAHLSAADGVVSSATLFQCAFWKIARFGSIAELTTPALRATPPVSGGEFARLSFSPKFFSVIFLHTML
jgi:hypothetical protein